MGIQHSLQWTPNLPARASGTMPTCQWLKLSLWHQDGRGAANHFHPENPKRPEPSCMQTLC
eukprot:scaffold149023_cov15-Tisochrysis_lutea.AAC.1